MSLKKNLQTWLGNKKNWKIIIIPALIIIAFFIAGRLFDVQKYLGTIQDWVWKLGPWGPLFFGALYVGGVLLLLPGTPFTIIAALLFGTLWGYVTMLSATTVAATIAFFIARYMAKEKIEKRLAGLDAFQEIKDWVEKNHWLAISFIRIMPVFPFALNNYALGLTDISFGAYILVSELVFIPMTAVLVLGAQAIYIAMIRGEISWGMMAGSIGAGLVVLVIGMAGKKTFAASSY